MYHNFRDMPVWQNAMDLAVEVFHITSALPRSEDLLTVSLQIFLKDLVDIITKTQKTFFIIQEVHYTKLKRGSLKQKTEN